MVRAAAAGRPGRRRGPRLRRRRRRAGGPGRRLPRPGRGRADFDRPDDARFTLSVGARPAALTLRVDRRRPARLARAARPARPSRRSWWRRGPTRSRASSDGDGNSIVGRGPTGRRPTRSTWSTTRPPPTRPPTSPTRRSSRWNGRHLDSLARCTWRVYGHTYVASFLYHPDEVWRMVEAGRLHSIVAVDQDDEVVGHVGIELERPDDVVGDATLALVDPRYRGHHLLRSTQTERRRVMDELGLWGTLAEAVTPHTITQRTRVESGATETGILLGFIPASMTYRGLLGRRAGRQPPVGGAQLPPAPAVAGPDRPPAGRPTGTSSSTATGGWASTAPRARPDRGPATPSSTSSSRPAGAGHHRGGAGGRRRRPDHRPPPARPVRRGHRGGPRRAAAGRPGDPGCGGRPPGPGVPLRRVHPRPTRRRRGAAAVPRRRTWTPTSSSSTPTRPGPCSAFTLADEV